VIIAPPPATRTEMELVRDENAALKQALEARDETIRKQQAQIRRQQWLIDARGRESSAASDKLRETSSFLHEIYRTMPGALVVFDRQGTIEVANDSALTMLEYAEGELIGQPISTIFDPREVPTIEQVEALRVRRGVLRGERTCRTKSGQDVPVLFSATVYGKSAEGDPARGVVCVALDLRERKRLETELNLAQKLESVGRLAAGVAHEINTPIQFVNDSIQFVREAVSDLSHLIEKYRALHTHVQTVDPGAELAEQVSHTEDEVDVAYLLQNLPQALDRSLEGLGRVATIVRSMKEYAHPDQKEMRPADLNRCISSTLTIARNEFKYVADLELQLGDLPPVVCHAGDINQVVLNLVVNAGHAVGDLVKGTERRGRITVTTRAEGTSVIVAVADTGGGIPANVRDRIFDPFFTTKEVGRGTGQGLAIARKIVLNHGGQLTFETEVDRGTTFFLRLPIAGNGD
jgi:PAS domain S-box-containing protein